MVCLPWEARTHFLAMAQKKDSPVRDVAGTTAEAACANEWNNVKGVRTGDAGGASEYLPQTSARLD